MYYRKALALLITLTMVISLCACKGSDQESSPEAESDGKDYTTGTPWMDIDLDGVVTDDTAVDIKDDYALYVNKDDILSLEIQEGYPYAGTVIDVVTQTDEDIKNMFLGDAPESHDARLAYDLFGLLMDWDSRNAQGVAPLKERTDAVEAISSIDELSAYYTDTPIEKQLFCLWDGGIDIDLADSSKYSQYIYKGDVILKDSAEYKNLTEYGKIRKEAAEILVRKKLVKLGYSEDEAQEKFDNCIKFETMLAPAIPTTEDEQKPDFIEKMANYYSKDQLKEAEGNVPFLEWMEQAKGYPEADEYWVVWPDYVTKLNELYTDDNLQLIKDTIIVNGAFRNAYLLDRECYEWDTEFTNAVRGSSGMLDDETVMSGTVSETLEWPVAQLYTETYLKQEDKDRISEMIDEVLEEYHGIINEAEFLSEDTKAKAIEKLEAIGKNVLFPDSWDVYSCNDLTFASKDEGGTLWAAEEAITKYNAEKAVRDYSKPVDKTEWKETPHTVNCFYYPQNNQIYIMGAFAKGNIYNSGMSDEELYAKVGTVIGHEISHAFDPSGSQFDKNGDMADWWTAEDKKAFQTRTDKLAAYYNNMHPWEGQDFRGETMTGEACADMAGMKCMLRIAAQKKDFDYDKFFRAYANLWLTKDTLQEAYARIKDTHPMTYLRINGTLQQYDEFLDFYDIKEGDNMYLAPEDRVAIW